MLGKTIANRYKITEEFSSDSLTILHKALDQAENKPVFVTLLREKAKSRPLETILRYKRLQEQLSKLSHPNLLKVHSQGEFEGVDYLVTEYADSNLLSQLLTQPQYVNQPLNIDATVEIILQISSALDLCHQHNLLHQSLNPQSILIAADLKAAKLTNFGYNLLQDLSRITEQLEIVSTFGYLSPEASGILRKPIDSRSDIYSFGILFYQLLTGRLPYLAEDVGSLIHQHIATKPESPSKFNPKIPPVLDNIILRLIAKDPQDRYQSFSGLIFDLMEYQGQRAQGEELIDFEIARFDKLRQLNFSTRLIGRDSELNQLKSLLDQTKQGKGSLCFVYGEPGIGKSRLIDELRAQVYSIGGFFTGGKCYQYEFRTPYKVFSEAIDAYIEKVKRLSQKEQESHIKRIKETLGELGGEVVKIAPTITDFISQPPKLVELEPEKEKIRFLITVTNFLSVLSTQDSPLLMFLDDLQWVDDGSLEILERLTEKLHNSSILLIISYRDTEVDQNHPLAQLIKRLREQGTPFSGIAVKSFTLHETAQMIGQILMEKEEAVPALAQLLLEKAKGNPFFTLELMHSLVDLNLVSLQGEHYIYDLDQIRHASLPENIVDIVLKRMAGLPETELQILSYASVMGKELDFKLLTELVNKPTDQILNSIERGIQNQLLYRDLTGRENIFFMHDRIREAFYKRVPEEERISLHKHIAEVLEEQNKNNSDPVLYELAYHFTQGQAENKALQYSIPAANKAKSSYANILAICLYNTAKGILEKQNKKDSQEYIEVLENLGEAYRLAGKFEQSIEVLKACESLIPTQDIMHRAQILLKTGDTLWDKGEVDESTKILEYALRTLGIKLLTDKLGVMLGILKELIRQIFHMWFPKIFVSDKYKASSRDLITSKILIRLGHDYYFSDINKTFYVFMKCLNLSEKLGPCSDLAYSYICGAVVWSNLFWFKRAFRDGLKGLKIAQELNDKIREGGAYAYLAVYFYFVGKAKLGLEYAQKGINILKGLGEYWDLGLAYAYRNHNNWLSGRFKEGLSEAEEFVKVAKEANALQSLGWALFDKGFIASFIGEIDDSVINDIKEGNKLMKITRDRAETLFSTSMLAFAYLRSGNYVLAIQTIEESVRLFPTHYNKGIWTLDLFPMGAQIYLDTIVNTNPSLEQKKQYVKRAKWFCQKANRWSYLYKLFLGWTIQVNGTYLWLTGKKRRAISTWEKGIKFLRQKTEDKYRLAYILLEEAKFLLQDNPKDKKAYSYLIEARDLFTEMGCKLDLETCNKLLESISPEGVVLDSRQVLTQKRHLDSLLSVTQAIGSIFVLDELLQKILEYGLKVTGAERGFLLLHDEKDKQLKLKVSHGLEKDLANLSFSYENYKLSLELINEVNNTKTAAISDQQTAPNAKIQTELKNFQVKQAIAVPLRTREKPLGILYMDNRLAGGMFGKDELELMKSFAVQASVSIDNAYLVSNLVEQERLKQELELGRQIQESLLPRESPVIPGLKLCGLMLPAKEIGGDYYDFITPDKGVSLEGQSPAGILPTDSQTRDIPAAIQQAVPLALEPGEQGSVSIVIGDVSGKGVAAGLLMAMAKTAIHTLSQEETSPRNVLLRTNQILVKHIGSQKFMTMLYFRYDPSSRTLTYSSAGHEHILVYRNDSSQVSVDSNQAKENQSPDTNHVSRTTYHGHVESILSGGFMLGMIPDIASFLEDKTIQLNPGDKVILYTDGVTEARNPQEELFSLERLIDIISKYGSKPAEELLTSIKEEVYSFIGTREQYDDITLVVMEAA